MLLLFVWNHSYFLARSLGSSRVQLLENIPSKLAWGTFCAKMPSNLLYYCLFLHNDLLLFGQVAAHLIQRSHTTQKHQLPTVHKMQIFIKEQQLRIWPIFLPSHLSCFLGIHYWVDHQIPWVHWRSSRWKRGFVISWWRSRYPKLQNLFCSQTYPSKNVHHCKDRSVSHKIPLT